MYTLLEKLAYAITKGICEAYFSELKKEKQVFLETASTDDDETIYRIKELIKNSSYSDDIDRA